MSGFFGCVSRKECVGDVFYGTDYHSHLGTKRGGMVFFNGESFVRSIHSLENAYFRNKFEPDLDKFENSKLGMGIISDLESQPITITSRLGRFSILTVGKIENLKELSEDMLAQHLHFSELSGSDINPTELVAILISREESFEEGVKSVFEKIKGSCSMLILTETGIYAIRDKVGRTPVILGKNDSGYTVAFESSSFGNLGYETVRDLGPSEMVFITPDGILNILPPKEYKQVCSFLWVYYGYPSSYYEGVNVESCRYKCGEALAKRDADLEVDFAGGIPDSGIGHAIGYCNGKDVDYKRTFVKYTPTWPRSFMPQNQKMRDLVAKMKLIPNKELTQGRKVVFLDDSIVRGTQLKDNVIKLIEGGIKEVHMRIACPPLIFPCEFLNFSTSRSSFDLYTRRIIRDMEGTSNFSDETLLEYTDPNNDKYKKMLSLMQEHLQLSSLKFQHLDDLVKAIGLPKKDLCTHCFDNSSK